MSEDQLRLVSRVDPTPAIQTHRFAAVMSGLLRRVFPDLRSYDFVPVQDFPVARKLWFEGGRFERDGHPHRSLTFINALVFKQVTRFASLLRHYRELAACDLLIVHGLHMPNLAFAVLLRPADVRIGVVLTDEHGLVLSTDGAIRRMMKRVDGRLVSWMCGGFDFSIALSPALAATYTPGRPTVVFPGIYDHGLEARMPDRTESRVDDDVFRVLYFGGLNEAYGVQGLLDALPLLAPRVELRLFGRGPLEEAIAARARATPNLHWGGLVDQDRLVAEMAGCDLLINARSADGRLARMSSPSKLLEYAASGRAVATTRLPTIPPDVMARCVPIEASTGPAVADAVNRAAGMTGTALSDLGRAFQERMRQRYGVDALVGQLAALFDSVATREARPGRQLDVEPRRR